MCCPVAALATFAIRFTATAIAAHQANHPPKQQSPSNQTFLRPSSRIRNHARQRRLVKLIRNQESIQQRAAFPVSDLQRVRPSSHCEVHCLQVVIAAVNLIPVPVATSIYARKRG